MLLVKIRQRVLLPYIRLLTRALAQLRQSPVYVLRLLLHRAVRFLLPPLFGIVNGLDFRHFGLALQRQRSVGPHVGPRRVRVADRGVALARLLAAVFKA